MEILAQILAFVITILVLVSFHEAGHFFVAKWLGIKVLKYSIGFGKPLLKFYDKKGTEYIIAVLPLGGYVKLLDEREMPVPPAELPYAFNRQPLWKRVLVVLAGPMTNILLAILGFWLMFLIGVQVLKPIVGEVTPHSIAAQAGLKTGDEILRVDDHPTPSLQKVLLAVVARLGEKSPMTIMTENPITKQTTLHQLDLSNWQVNRLNPAPLDSLGIKPYRPSLPATITALEPTGPAAQSGLAPQDLIIAIDNHAIKDWYQFVEYIDNHPGEKIIITYKRNGQIKTTSLVIQARTEMAGKRSGYIGVKTKLASLPPNLLLMRHYPPVTALYYALTETKDFVWFNYVVLKKMIQGKISLSSLGGPITIFQTADIAFRQGVSVYLGFLALISVMLAFINILPIPGLDGGHLLNYLIEFIIRRPLSLRFELLSMQVGMILLILLMLLATFNDLLRLFN